MPFRKRTLSMPSTGTKGCYLQFDIRELFLFGPFDISLAICIIYIQLGAHVLLDFVTFFLPLYFIASRYFLEIKPDPASNIIVQFNDLVSTCHVEIGGQQHDPNWKERFRPSFLPILQKYSMRGFRALSVNLCLNINSALSLEALGLVIRALVESATSGSRKGLAVELDITVPRSVGTEEEMQSTVQRADIDLEHLAPRLRKLTWCGPFADFLFTRPPYNSFHDVIFRRELKVAVTFSSLVELRLLDCVVEARTLIEMLAHCPVLTTLEVQTIGIPSCSSKYWTSLDEYVPGSAVVRHLHLRHLRISSIISLSPLFESLCFYNLETLCLTLAPSAIISCPEIDIPRLAIPWNTLSYFEFKAPMGYCSLDSLTRFLSLEPSIWRRSHVLTDSRDL